MREDASLAKRLVFAEAFSSFPNWSGHVIARFRTFVSSDSIRDRALKGTAVSVATVGAGHVLRFGSNLVLTRLLFPEAFGLMALVQVVLSGLVLMSDVGLRVSVMQNPRGDDEDFLNTVWTMQVLRGVFLWLMTCALAFPMAAFYDQPLLASILPVAGLSLLVSGFNTTNVLTAQRHMRIARYSWMTLIAQAAQIAAMTGLAYILQSVWALAIGTIFHSIIMLFLYQKYVPGIRNGFRYDPANMREIFSFGKFLFISTLATFAISQSDRAILGLAIPIDLLGIYGIAFTLATLPSTLSSSVAGSVVFPLYRMRHPSENPANRANLFRARRLVVSGTLALNVSMAMIAPWFVSLIYDDRYVLAGPIAVILCMANVPLVVFSGVINAVLTKGDSFRTMIMNVTNALLQTGFMYVFVMSIGIVGAALAIGLTQLLTYPLLAVFLRRYGSWDIRGDLALMSGGLMATGLACAWHWNEIQQLL